MIISVFIPHGGCPERCSFCDQKVSGGKPLRADEVRERIIVHTANGSRPDQIAFYGATFTSLRRDLQKAYLNEALPYLQDGRIGSVRIATRPDAIDRDWIQELKEKYYLKTVELGVQTFNERALRALGRTHTNESVFAAVTVLRALGLEIGLHFMIGLPEETQSDDAMMLENILRLRPDFVRLHPLLVFRNTELGRVFSAGKFKPIDLESAVDRCAALTEKLESQAIPVHRLGLQPNEAIPEELLGGPYHPAFGELVRSRIWRRRLSQDLMTTAPAACESQLRGKNNSNIRWLEKHLNLPVGALSVVKGPSNEVRILNTLRPTERRQIEPSQ